MSAAATPATSARCFAAATVSGPLIGGLSSTPSWLGWRWCFYVGVPVGVLALVVLQRTLHVPTLKREVQLDYLGAALITGGVSTLLIWISLAGSQFAWGSATVADGRRLGIARWPPPSSWSCARRSRSCRCRCSATGRSCLAVLGSIVLGLVMFGGSVFLGQYFQIARGPTRRPRPGLLTLPLVGGLMLSSTLSGQLISRYGRWKGFLVIGAVLTHAGPHAAVARMDHDHAGPAARRLPGRARRWASA